MDVAINQNLIIISDIIYLWPNQLLQELLQTAAQAALVKHLTSLLHHHHLK
jgi:hypothetical protein